MPEVVPINATVHFKCAFDVRAKNELQPMTYLRRHLRSWCISKVGENEPLLHRSWFFVGNNPRNEPAQHDINDHQIRTVAAPSEDPQEPNCWAVEVIHSDRDERARRWSAEATLRKNEDGTVRFCTVIKNWMISYFIGEYPDPPVPSVPQYVRWIVDDDELICSRGDAQLQNQPETVTSENARSVFEQLISDTRQVPFIFLAPDRLAKRLPVSPAAILRPLLGNANVFALASEAVVDEMKYYLGDDFRCGAGALRVYVPNMNLSNPDNARMHRYLSPSDILENGQNGVIRILTNGLARNGGCFRLSDLTSFQDIFSERRKHAIKRLAAESIGKTQESQELWEEFEKAVSDASTWKSLAEQYESENSQLQSKNGELGIRIAEADRVRHKIGDLESQVKGMRGMSRLPTNLGEILEAVAELFPTRLVFTDDARAVALDYSHAYGSHWCRIEQLTIAWELVFCTATKLYDLLFLNPSKRLETDFEAESKFGLAMSEGKQTKKDSKLMNLRRVTHNGKEHDITPHVKYGNQNPKMLRLHFAVDREEKLLVVGHFGDHLDNSSTRKL